MRRRAGRRPGQAVRAQRGAATAELALGLPLLLAVTLALTWLLAVGSAQVRTVDAAREAARAAARGDDDGAAAARGEQVAPSGSTVTLARSGGDVVATVSGEVAGPGGLLRFLPGVTVHAQATARDEAAP